MKRIVLAVVATGLALASIAQKEGKTEKVDTIRIGGISIVKTTVVDSSGYKSKQRSVLKTKPGKISNLTTNWWILDLGFANYTDNSNYSAAQSQGFVGTGVGQDQMKLRIVKSINVNIWMFMQKLNLIKHVVNLKYGLGVELNNYRFEDDDIILQKDPTKIVLNTPIANQPAIEKDKLAADYITVPLMINFNFTPERKSGFGFSAGISEGYLYSARQKFKDSDDKKTKTHNDFDLEQWKLSYVGELTLGPVRLYGSMASKSMWTKGLDQTPYNIGLRFSHF